jgi:hypothetical protein
MDDPSGRPTRRLLVTRADVAHHAGIEQSTSVIACPVSVAGLCSSRVRPAV